MSTLMNNTLTGHIPTLIAYRFAMNPSLIIEPNLHPYSGAILVVDISTLTTLTTHLRGYGSADSEEITQLLKTNFERVVDVITKHGGDIVKFTGDTLQVLWLENIFNEPLATVTLRAAQCALELRDTLHNQPLTTDLHLILKISLSLGEVLTTDVGGVYGRWEFLVTGAPVVQANRAQSEAEPGDIVITPQAWSQLQDVCVGQPMPAGHTRLTTINTPLVPQQLTLPTLTSQAEAGLRGYIPGVSLTRLGTIQASFFAEILPITTLVINLPDLTHTTSIDQIQKITRMLQTTLYDYEGSVVRISIDHEGIRFIAALGLPPVAHDNDATLAVQTALAVKAGLQAQMIGGAIGVTTGYTFCGLVGNEQRHEYTIIGQGVAVAEQLMYLAKQSSNDPRHPKVNPQDIIVILCDSETYELAQNQVAFEPQPTLALVEHEFTIYEPIANLEAAEEPPLPDMDRWMDEIYERFKNED